MLSLMNRFGRKLMFIIYLTSAGLICLIVAGIPRQLVVGDVDVSAILIIVFTGFGKAFVSASFNCAYIYLSQMYPTNVRNTLVLFIMSLGRIGSLISPQINLLRDLWPPLPFIVFGLISLLCSVFLWMTEDPAKKKFH